MQLIFMGTPEFAAVALKKIISEEHTVLCVFTQPDKPKGRSGKPVPSPVKLVAEKAGIKVYQPEKLRDEENVTLIRELDPEIIVVAAYGQILPESILSIPKLGCVNIHASLLPRYRGAAPIERSILDGERKTGITTMYMAKGLDTGDILEQAETDILPEDTGESLTDKLAELGAELIISTMNKLQQGTVTPVPQDDSAATYAAKLDKEMGLLDFSLPAQELERTIRALTPWPGTFTYLDGKKLKILSAEVTDTSGKPGEFTEVTKKSLTVACGSNGLKIKKLQPEGKKPMDTAAFLNGNHISVGMRLGE